MSPGPQKEKLVRQGRRGLYGITFVGIFTISAIFSKPFFDKFYKNKNDIEKIETPIRAKPRIKKDSLPQSAKDTLWPPRPILA